MPPALDHRVDSVASFLGRQPAVSHAREDEVGGPPRLDARHLGCGPPGRFVHHGNGVAGVGAREDRNVGVAQSGVTPQSRRDRGLVGVDRDDVDEAVLDGALDLG